MNREPRYPNTAKAIIIIRLLVIVVSSAVAIGSAKRISVRNDVQNKWKTALRISINLMISLLVLYYKFVQ